MNFYDDASWLLIPSGIKEDVVYAQKPTSGLGDLTFTRASDATYTDSTGVVRRSPYNLVTWSEMFTDTSWTKSSTTISANVTTAPNGNATADLIYPTSSGNYRLIRQSTFSPWSGTYTASIYAKAAGINNLTLLDYDATGAGINFNLSTGVATDYSTNPFISYSMTAVGDGWYRCTATALNGYYYWFLSDGGSAVSVTANGTNGVYIWGAQLVEGTEALDYFPTTNRQDVPRIDFRNANGTLSSCGRLLLEPQRTNFVLRSEEFDSATWTKSLTTVVANAEISPDGTQDAETMTVSTSASFVEQTVALTAGTYTFSVYVKVISQTTAGQMRLQAVVDGVGLSVNFTPTTQWQRFTSTYTPTATLTNVRVRGQTFVGTVAVWGAQLEAGAYATTYIPTTTAAVTRLADAASKTGVSSLIGQTEGTLFIDVNLDTRQSFTYFAIAPNLSSGTAYIGFAFFNNQINFEVLNTGSQAVIVFTNNSTGRFKLAAAYKQNDFVFYVNGVLVGTDTSGTVPACSQIGLFNYSQVQALQYNQAALFPTRLTNAQLAQLTTL